MSRSNRKKHSSKLPMLFRNLDHAATKHKLPLNMREFNHLLTSVHSATHLDWPLLNKFASALNPDLCCTMKPAKRALSRFSKLFDNQIAFQYSTPSSKPVKTHPAEHHNNKSFPANTITAATTKTHLYNVEPPPSPPSSSQAHKSAFSQWIHKLAAGYPRQHQAVQDPAMYKNITATKSLPPPLPQQPTPQPSPDSCRAIEVPSPTLLLNSFTDPLLNTSCSHPTTHHDDPTSMDEINFMHPSPPSEILDIQSLHHTAVHAPPAMPVRESNFTQYLHLIIKSHESNEMELSYQYLLDAQKLDPSQPMTLFLKGIYLRHGWGCLPNLHGSYACLYQAMQLAISAAANCFTPGSSAILIDPLELEPRLDQQNVLDQTCPLMLRPPSDLAKFRSAHLPPPPFIPNSHTALLALILFEISSSLRFGWGCTVQRELAFQVDLLSANMGDIDACVSVGYYALKHGDKRLASKYLRWASFGGWKDVGVGWIFKEKYDED